MGKKNLIIISGIFLLLFVGTASASFPGRFDNFIMYIDAFLENMDIKVNEIDINQGLNPRNITPCSNGEILETSGGIWICAPKPGGGSGESKWVHNGTWLTPNASFANSVNLSEVGGFLDVIDDIYIGGIPLGARFMGIENNTGFLASNGSTPLTGNWNWGNWKINGTEITAENITITDLGRYGSLIIDDNSYIGSASEPEAIQITGAGTAIVKGELYVGPDGEDSGITGIDGRLAILLDGGPVHYFDETSPQLEIAGDVQAQKFFASLGSVTSPTYTFTDDDNTGMYGVVEEDYAIISFSVDGVKTFEIDDGSTYTYGYTFTYGNSYIEVDSATIHVPIDTSKWANLKIENINRGANTFTGIYMRSGTYDAAITAIYSGSTNKGRLAFYDDYSGTGRTEEVMTIKRGNIGIWNNAPATRLDVNGTVRADEFLGNWNGSKAIYAQLSDLVDQEFAFVGIAQPVNLTTTDDIYGLTVDESNVTASFTGVYSIFAQPQVTAGPGDAGLFHMWLEKHNTTDWVNVSNSNVELSLASNEEDVIPLIVVLKLNAGEAVRVMASVSDTGISLDAQILAGEPSIPSIIFTMYKVGD